MKIVSWNEWLDKHIPYYEAERHRNRFLENPPQSVLIVYVTDRANWHVPGQIRETWDDLHNKIQSHNLNFAPLFLERDTKQEWYWAFWEDKKLTFLLLKLT